MDKTEDHDDMIDGMIPMAAKKPFQRQKEAKSPPHKARTSIAKGDASTTHTAPATGQDGPDDTAEEPVSPWGVWKFFIAFGIILLLLVGIIAYNSYRSNAEREKNAYNGFDFTPAAGGLWVTQISIANQIYDVPFYYHPRDTLTVLIDPTATAPLLKQVPKEVVISVDPDAGPMVVIAGVEIARITGTKYNMLNLNTHSALSRPANNTVNFPIVTCADATPDRVVIQFVQGPQDVIARSDKYPDCIILQYTDANESVRVADRYAYMLLQIMH